MKNKYINTTEYKLCAECKVLIPKAIKGNLCNKCKAKREKYRQEYLRQDNRYVEANKVYSSPRYKKARAECRKRAKGMCEICYHFGKRVQGEQAHHIISVINGDDTTHYDLDNLIYVCKKCHKAIEGMQRYELIEYLEK